MKRSLTAFVLAVGVVMMLGAGLLYAQMDRKTPSAADLEFMKEAASGGLMEVKLGQLASGSAESETVNGFGKRMMDDHSKSNQELMDLAKREGVAVPAEMNEEHRSMVEHLSKLKGEEFDREYMKHMVEDHQQDVDRFNREAMTADDLSVREYASDAVPTLMMHLELAKDIRSRLDSAG